MSVEEQILEIRGAESVEEATLEDIWIAGQPLGILVDKQRTRIEELQEENAELRSRVDSIEQTANSALGAARAADDGARADGSGPGKKDAARLAARNELVKRLLLDPSEPKKSAVTMGEIEQMCRPSREVAYQTVKDAVRQLSVKWAAFQVDENEDGKRVISAETRHLTKDLVGAVEVDLGRDDLTKRLISRRT